MKKKLFRIGSLLMAFSMLSGATSLTAFAATNGESTKTVGNTVYYTHENEKGSVENTGIKSITSHDTLFYDCSNNTEANVTTDFLINMLKSKKSYQGADGSTGDVTLLTQWANIAGAIFENGDKYTCSHNYADYYGKKHSTDSTEKCDVAALLANSNSVTKGSKQKDNYHTTGLSVTSSFKDLRYKMCEEISNRIGRYTLEPKNILSQGKNCDDALPEFNNDTNREIIYNIVTSISQDGKTCKYEYNSYGLAFYDFDLKIIDDENVEYVQDTSKTKSSSSVITKSDGSIDNYTLTDSTASATIQTSKSETVSTSMTNSQSYSYEEMFGGQFQVGVEGLLRGIIESSLTFQQVYESARTDSTTEVTSVTDTKTVNCTVPAHTTMDVEQTVSTDTLTVSYATPVAVTFKVAVFSMSGDVYADSALTLAFSTAGYKQSNFSTFFGGDNGTEGVYAYEALANKLNNSNINGWDATYGNNHFFYKKHNGKDDAINTTSKGLDWNKIAKTYDSYTGESNGMKNFAKKCPMLPMGTTTTSVVKSVNTTISNPIPLYLPKTFKIVDNTQKNFYVFKDGSYNLNTLKIGAFDRYGGAYYGFRLSQGHWSVKEGSENIIEFDPNTYSVKGKNVGTGYLVWTLNDDTKYEAKEKGTVTKDNANTVEIAITVRDYPFSS